MDIKQAIAHIVSGNDLTHQQMTELMQIIMQGEATAAQIAGFMVALRMKGETVDELTAAVGVMRSFSEKISPNADHLVDTCGTGGDGMHTFNISTTVSFVVAASGASVAKHGNRSVSSCSGSADVLDAAGVNLNLKPDQVAHCIEKIGIGFIFAPAYHPAMAHAAAPRRELGLRTLFNLLGPLSNPANPKNQVIGVFDRIWCTVVATVLSRLGSQHVLVVHADNGMDEISISGKTTICELRNGTITSYEIAPEDFGIKRADPQQLVVKSAAESLAILESVLDNQPSPARDIVCLNAAAAIYASGIAQSLKQGIELAKAALASGKAREKLIALRDTSQSF